MKYIALRYVQGWPHSAGGGPVQQLPSAAAAGVRPAGAGSWALDQPAAGGRGHGPAPPAPAPGGQQRADAGGTLLSRAANYPSVFTITLLRHYAKQAPTHNK